MFSGGRDSTLAATRLGRSGSLLVLITVSSGHLVGIDRVRQRLRELSKILPAQTPWIQVRQPTELRTDTSFYKQTCLPCHHAYVVVSGALARATGVHRLALGYSGYQAEWPEQTPLAIESLGRVLNRHGITLELPVRDILAREDAIRELADQGLDPQALEQKCIRQVSNVALDDELLRQQVGLWEAAIDQSIRRIEDIEITVLDQARLGELG